MLQIYLRPTSQTTTSQAGPRLPKRHSQEGNDVDDAVVTPPKIGKRFSPRRQRPSRMHPNKTPSRTTATPEDVVIVDTDTIAGKALA
jgi:hypothetical protein